MKLKYLGIFALTFRLLLVVFLLFIPSLSAGAAIVTQHNDAGRTGQNLTETVLNTSNVNVNSFGKLFARTVDGQIYAQPLYLPGLTMQGGTHNVVFVATMHNSVYAFDADDPNASVALWQVNLGTPVPSQDISSTYRDITPEIGVLSTPVIDPASGTIYVVAKTKNTGNSTYHFQLHALDVLTGAEKFAGPVEITGQVSGTGDGSTGGQVLLDPLHHLNRPGLLLLNGILYLGFGSLGDIFPYHGWVLAYNASTLQPAGIFNATPNGSEGAIWQGGNGLAGDAAGNIYLMTGNGTFNANSSGTEYGDSFLKLTPSPALTVADYFTPFNQAALSSSDADLGSGGPMLLPGTSLMAGMGKDGILRLLNTNNLGKFNSASNNDLQEFQAISSSFPSIASPIYWNSPNNGPAVYLWGPNDFLKAFKFTGSSFQTTPVSQSTMTEVGGDSTSVPLSLSANGSQAGTGIIWASAAFSLDPNQQTVPGILRAFNAMDLSVELWNSRLNAARDDVGNYGKFAPPTIANGKVYLATFSSQLLAYGLLNLTVSTPYLSSGTIGSAYNQTLTAANGQTPYSWSIVSGSGSLPAGLTLNPGTGVISGTPTATGTSTFTVQVQDANLATASRVLSLSIVTAAQTLVIDKTVSGDSSATGTAISTPTLTTSAANELLVAFVSGSSPGTGANTTVTGVTNTGGALTWTRAVVTNVQQGTAEIWWAYATTALSGTVTATMSQSVASRSITVVSFIGAASGADAIGATGSGNAMAGAPTASLLTTRANSWVFGVGNDWTAQIARTPGAGQTLVHQFLSPTADTYWVQSQASTTPLAGTAITINDTAPTGDLYNLSIVEIRTQSSGPVPLSITTTALASGTVNVPYPNQNMSAAGGSPPYSWSATGLPSGLSMSSAGVISGTATASGTFGVAVKVVDSVAASATTNLSLTIALNQALTVDATVFSDSSATGASITTPLLTTSAANELLVAFIAGSSLGTAINNTVTGVTNTGGSLTWTRAVVTNVQQGTAEIWWAYATTPVSGTVTATMSQSVASRCITVVSFIGAAGGADAIGAIGSGNAAAGAPTASLVTTRANSRVFGVGNDWTAQVGRTPGSGQSLVHQFLSPTADTYWVQSLNSATALAGTTVTINDTAPTGDLYNLSLVEIRTVSGPPVLTSLSLLPASVVGGSPSQGTVTLSAPASGAGAVVSLASSDPSTATVSPTVTVPAGSSSATFPISTVPVALTTMVSISASYGTAPSQNAILTVTPPLPLSVTTSTLASGTVGAVYPNQTMAATGGVPPYTWSATGLPGGLAMSSAGVLGGTPTAAGTFIVAVQVTDSAAAQTSKNLNLTIAQAQALAIDATVSGDSSATGTTITTPTLRTNAANELLVAFISGSAPSTGTNSTVRSVTNTGGALTWTRAVVTNAQRGTAEIWWAYATAPLSGTVTATLSRSVASRSITVMSFTGTASGAAAIGATASGSAAAGAPTASLITTRANSWIFGTGNDWTAQISRTLGPGQAMVHQFLSPTADTYWVQGQISSTPLAGTTVTINDTAPAGDKYNLSIIEIRTP
jgi:hypothetical protein